MNSSGPQKNKVFFAILWLFPFFFLLILFITSYTYENPTNISNAVQVSPVSVKLSNPENILARAYIVKDLNTGKIIFQKNSDMALPLASITKVMTALVTKDLASSVNNVSIAPNIHNAEDKYELFSGDSFPLKKLLDYTLVSSSNDGAAAIAQAVQRISNTKSFVDKMNDLATAIGMQNTHFLNETGLDENPNQAGAFGSAADVALLMEYTLKNFPETFEATKDEMIRTSSNLGFIHSATNTNSIVNELPNVIASKTGFTDIAGGNLAVVIDPSLNRPVVIVVLGSTKEGRFEDTLFLSDAVSKYFSLVD